MMRRKDYTGERFGMLTVLSYSKTINGITKQMIDWCKEAPVTTTTVYKRMRDGWNVIDALTKPDQRKISIR